MPTARIFQLIDLERLSPELAETASEASAQSEAMGFDLLHGVVAAILHAEPGHYGSMIGLARAWFTRNLESLEQIENAHKNAATSNVLEGLNTQVTDNCQAARRLALRALKTLNAEYAASQVTLEEDSEERLFTLHAAFMMFYREMEEVELHIAEANIRARALQARAALETANSRLKYRYLAVGRLGGRIAELRRQIAKRETKLLPDVNSQAFISQIVDGREVFILEDDEIEALRQRSNGLVERQAPRKQTIEEIERVHAAVMANRSDEEIQRLMMGTHFFRSVGERWGRAVREKQKLQEKMAAIRPLVEQQVKLQADKERYTTNDIIEWVFKQLKIPDTVENVKSVLSTDDVDYHLEKLVGKKRISAKQPKERWSLTRKDYEIAREHVLDHLRRKRKREAKRA